MSTILLSMRSRRGGVLSCPDGSGVICAVKRAACFTVSIASNERLTLLLTNEASFVSDQDFSNNTIRASDADESPQWY